MPKLSSTVISDMTVRAARPQTVRFEIRDAELRGFMLRVSPSGLKSWYVQIDRNRKRKIGDAAVLTASMARYRAKDLLMRAEHLQRGPAGQRDNTLGAFLSGRYASWMARNRRFGARDTQRLLRALGELASLPIDQLGASQIERWKLQRAGQVRPATVTRELNALRAALGKAQVWGLVTDNPARRVKYRAERSGYRIRMLTDSERTRLMARLARRGDPLAVLVITALNTGLRRGELFRLRWRDIHLGMHPALEVRNTSRQHGRSRKVPLNATAASAIQRLQQDRLQRGTLVFPGPTGGSLKNISEAWAELMRETRIRDFRLADCRHDFAARLAAATVPLSTIRDLLGLSTLSLVERYAVFAPGTHQTAVERLL